MAALEPDSVTTQDLLLIIGELVVENRLLRARLATPQAKEEEVEPE